MTMLNRMFIGLQTRMITRERGQGLTEYALLILLIVAVAAVGVRFFGKQLQGDFQNALDGIFNA
jgi:Flp pilus assembly pilin Flp